MKTFVLTTVGSTGDVVPHLALARGLLARGHRVRVCSHSFHRDFFQKAAIDFVAVGAPLEVADFNRLMDLAAREGAPIKQFDVLVRQLFLREAARAFSDLTAAMSDADFAVCQRFDYVGQEAARKRGIPWASVTMVPQLIPTAEAPVYPTPNLGKTFSKMTWIALENMAEPTNKHAASVLRSLGCAPRKLDVAGASSPLLDLVPASPVLVQARGDWPRHVKLTGAWTVGAPADYQPDNKLADFLASKPLVFTFGSMGGSAGRDTAVLLLDAVARVGKPAIVQHGYSGLMTGASLPPRVMAVGHVPHDYLFRRASCVIHHAGAGTAHAALESGAPSAPVPHLFDQYYWAGRLHEIGIAPKVIFRHQMSAKKLAKHIEEALGMGARASALGARVAAEKGVEAAIAAIESVG